MRYFQVNEYDEAKVFLLACLIKGPIGLFCARMEIKPARWGCFRGIGRLCHRRGEANSLFDLACSPGHAIGTLALFPDKPINACTLLTKTPSSLPCALSCEHFNCSCSMTTGFGLYLSDVIFFLSPN